MFTHLIWDFDGTLFNTYPGMVRAFQSAARDFGADIGEEEILLYMKTSVTTAIGHCRESYGLGDGFIERYRQYEKEIRADEVEPFPYARELCRDFQKNGGVNFILTHRGNSVYRFLGHYGMTEYFEEIATRHNGFRLKPDPEGFTNTV